MSDRDKPGERPTTPPPYEEDERTAVTNVPEELIAESLRGAAQSKPPAPAPTAGLRQMFSHDPSAIREALPSPDEGDALLDMLFDDAHDERAAEPQPRSVPPPLPPPPAPPHAAPPRPARPPAPPPPPPRPAAAAETLPPEGLEDDEDDVAATRAMEFRAEAALVGAAPTPMPGHVSLRDEPVDEATTVMEETDRLPAVPLPSRRPPVVELGDVRDANTVLVDAGMRDAWLDRAQMLRAEAEAMDDRAARGRTLLVASELFAMAGEETTALAVARESRELMPNSPLPSRQVRALLTRTGDRRAAFDLLEHETKVAPTPGARCHGALLASALAAAELGDGDLAARHLDFATRASPGDPRPHIQRICTLLSEPGAADAASGALAKLRIPESVELAPLADATAELAALLAPQPHRVARSTSSPFDALLRARSALDGGDVSAAVQALEALQRGDSTLSAGAAWLTAAVAAPRAETRSRAAAALAAVVDGSHGDVARRALAARAIESGDAQAAAAATQSADGGAFSLADRIALAALTRDGSSGLGEDVAGWIDSAGYDGELAALTAAATAALSNAADPGRRVPAVGSSHSRAATSLGRSLAAVAGQPDAGLMQDEALVGSLSSLGEQTDGAALLALAIEVNVDAGAGGRVALAVSQWPGEGVSERDRALAGAMLAEVAGETDRTIADLDRARAADPSHEGAARARAWHADPRAAAAILSELAQAVEAPTRAATLLTECAVRRIDADASEEAEPLLRRAADLEPKLPLAVHLGERAARGRGDRDALVDWLRRRREISDDPIEQAHDLVREALLLSDAEGSPAASLLEQALRARPSDVGLRELYERLAPEPPADYAAWRADRANELTGADAARMALEAALEFERVGDVARAAACAHQAMAAGDDALAPISAYRSAMAGHGASDLFDGLLARARASEDPVEKVEIYERLADLDEFGRSDAASGLLWRRTILEEIPGHLPTLRRIAGALIGESRDEELEPIALAIAKALPGPEGAAHAMLAARLRLRIGSWDETREAVELAYKHEPRGIWALRQMAAHARAKNEHQLSVEADRQLLDRTDRPVEAATLALRAAQDAVRAGELETARDLLAAGVELAPTHLVVRLVQAKVLDQLGDHQGAAVAWEAAAAASLVPTERLKDLHEAQRLWLDHVKDVPRARAALEAIAEVDPSYGDVFSRLQAIYVAEGARAELATLLRRRLEGVSDPTERVEMEVLRGRALAEVGETGAAKHALATALEANPDHVDALRAFSDLCAAEGDWSGAEQAWIRLARLVSDPPAQVEIYLKLGELYDERVPNPERAELAYREILKRSNDESARERLVRLYRRVGDAGRAIEEQTVLITGATVPEAKCKRTCELAEIYEAGGDLKKSEATLLNARKTWPKDDYALASLVRFYQRTNQGPAAHVLLDRAVADARRALSTGRFEPFLFSTIATVADLRGRPDAARIAHATVAALEGQAAALEGAGNQAGDPRLDDLLAPEVMTPAFRELLLKTGPLLDTAVPFDLASIRATPLPPPYADTGEHIHQIAVAYGLPSIQVHASNALGAVIVPAGTSPPSLVIGHALLAAQRRDVLTFLVHRALKAIQANASAFSRTAPIDLWPLLAAYLRAFAPTWTPVGVDPQKLADAYGRVTRSMPARLDPQVGVLAADVIGSIGNRASTLNVVVNGWGDRAGLLAMGDPNVALTAIAWAGGHLNAPPAEGKDRVTWIGRNAEARELVVFSVSDGYADARARLGMAR